jgi:phospholipid/cholesterol/gamma-HCH transport system substrate-binding protein
MKKYTNELAVGIFVFFGLICLAYITVRLGDMEFFASEGYTLSAGFNSVNGLRVGSSVEIAGVNIGTVVGINLDTENDFRALVKMRIHNEIQISDDVIASIKTSGLIGDKYVSLLPGGSSSMLKDGDMITETTPLFDLEDLIGKFVAPGVN